MRALSTALALLVGAVLAAGDAGWHTQVPTGTTAGPALGGVFAYVAGGAFSAAGGYVAVTAVHAPTGSFVWSTNVTVPAGAVVPDQHGAVLVAAGPSGAVMAVGQGFAVWLDRGGAVRWTWAVKGVARRAVVSVNGTSVAISTDTMIQVFDIRNGQPRWAVPIPGAPLEWLYPLEPTSVMTRSGVELLTFQASSSVFAYTFTGSSTGRPQLQWTQSSQGDYGGRVTAGFNTVAVLGTERNEQYQWIITGHVFSADTGTEIQTIRTQPNRMLSTVPPTLTTDGKYLLMPSPTTGAVYEVASGKMVDTQGLDRASACISTNYLTLACARVSVEAGGASFDLLKVHGGVETATCKNCNNAHRYLVVIGNKWLALDNNFDGTFLRAIPAKAE